MCMETVLLENETKAELAQLQDELSAVQERLHALLRGTSFRVVLPELHDGKSGRIDAQKVANVVGVPLKRLSEGFGLRYGSVHRNPSAESWQPVLKPLKRCLEILHEFFEKPQTIRIWLNTPHPDFNEKTALQLILENKTQSVLRVLENAAAGVPV
jgi:hypothetical protein